MKLKNVCVAVVALALAVGMTACGGSASSTAFPINLSGAFCCKKTGHRKSSVPGLIVS